MIEELIQRVFATRNAVHLAHWKTKSFAQHSALGEFYDTLVEEIDRFVECYQGYFGLVSVKEIPSADHNNICAHLEHEVKWINENEEGICRGVKALCNLLEGLSGEYLRVIYKLENLS